MFWWFDVRLPYLKLIFQIPGRDVTFEYIWFPVEVWVLFPGKAWRRMLYLYICTVWSLCFVYFRITFLSSKVKLGSRFYFLSWRLIFLGLFILDVIQPSVDCARVGFSCLLPVLYIYFVSICKHSYIHTHIMHNWNWQIIAHSYSLNILLTYYPVL